LPLRRARRRYYPLRTCRVSSSAGECARGWNGWTTFQDCCRPGSGGAFPQGCTDFNREAQCWIPVGYFPDRSCAATNNLTRCSYNWGQYRTQEECCAPGRAFTDGCTGGGGGAPGAPGARTCWIGATWFPARACATTDDVEACSRGWGSWRSEAECCAAGNAFSDGCGESPPAAEPLPEVPPEDPFVAEGAQQG
jgi:hypothetical protein